MSCALCTLCRQHPRTAAVEEAWSSHVRASVYPFGRSLLASSATGLTEREVVILKHLAAGTPRVTIARQEVVSINTVKTQISRLYRKLDASNAADAVVRARALGWL